MFGGSVSVSLDVPSLTILGNLKEEPGKTEGQGSSHTESSWDIILMKDENISEITIEDEGPSLSQDDCLLSLPIDLALNQSPSDNSTNRPITSVWNYFSKLGNFEAQCNLCEKVLRSPRGSTTGLGRHLTSKHNLQRSEYLRKPQEKMKTTQPAQETVSAKKVKLLPSNSCAKLINMTLGQMIALDYQPFSIVDNKGFQKFVEALDPSYEIPSSLELSQTVIPELYSKLKVGIRNKISCQVNSMCSLSWTCDTWTSKESENYVAISCHYINTDFTMERFVLGTYRFHGKRLGLAVFEIISSVLQDWGLTEVSAPMYVIIDDAKDIQTASINCAWSFVPCLAYSLQGAIREAMESTPKFGELCSKARCIVSHYHHCAQAQERLNILQRQMEKPECDLVQIVDGSWNSVFQMFSNIHQQTGPISAELAESGTVEGFTKTEWQMVAAIVAVLQPINEVSSEIFSNSYPPLSVTIPIIHGIQNLLSKYQSNLWKSESPFLTYLIQSFKVNFFELRNSKINQLAMLFDPRFKGLILSDQERLKLTDIIISEVVQDDPPSSVSSDDEVDPDMSASNPECSFWMAFDELAKGQSRPNKRQLVRDQLKHYLSEPTVPRHSDPLCWWNLHQKRFFLLSPIARHYLCIPATRADSEWLSTRADHILATRRAHLNPQNLEKLVFLHGNLQS